MLTIATICIRICKLVSSLLDACASVDRTRRHDGGWIVFLALAAAQRTGFILSWLVDTRHWHPRQPTSVLSHHLGKGQPLWDAAHEIINGRACLPHGLSGIIGISGPSFPKVAREVFTLGSFLDHQSFALLKMYSSQASKTMWLAGLAAKEWSREKASKNLKSARFQVYWYGFLMHV